MNIRSLISACLISVATLVPNTAQAITVTQSGLNVSPLLFDVYGCALPCEAAGILELSTVDNWRSAQLKYTVDTQGALPPWDLYLHIGSLDRIGSGDLLTEEEQFGTGNSPNSPFNTLFALPAEVRTYGVTLGGAADAWDSLSTLGISIEQYYFGNEQLATASIVLDDRSVTSHRVGLWQLAAVPLPASLPLMLGGVVLLGFVRLRTSS